MSSFAPNLMQFVWLIFGLIVGSAQIIAAVLLLRDRGIGPWLMLVGAVLSLVGSVFQHLFLAFISSYGPSKIGTILQITGGFSSLGWLMFSAGLLIFAMQRRKLHSRIDQLESIAANRP